MLPIKLTQPCVHTQIFCFQVLHFALAPFPRVIINLSSVFCHQLFPLDLHINRLRLIHFKMCGKGDLHQEVKEPCEMACERLSNEAQMALMSLCV